MKPVQSQPEDDWDDHFHDQCGVFGVWGSDEAANHAYLGLHALQHRGQESAGIVSSDGAQLFAHRALGLVQDVFSTDTSTRLPGDRAIGHVRYSTAGGSPRQERPAHRRRLRARLDRRRPQRQPHQRATSCARARGQGSIFQTSSDTEVIVHLIARSQERTTADRVADALRQTRGRVLADVAHAQRDDRRARSLGLPAAGPRHASRAPTSLPPSRSAFDLIDAEYIRDVEPGEMVLIDKNGMTQPASRSSANPRKMCIFEYVYFARPDATLGNINVYEARKRMGRALAQESPVEADVVIPVPDSGVPAALGYAQEASIPFELGLVRSHYVGRTFIEPQSSIRHFGVRLKLSPDRALIQGKRVVVVDDSIVRGTTSRKIVKMLRDAGASEVHLRISSPPTRWPCYYGIDTPDAQRADRLEPHRRRDRQVHHRRHARVPERASPAHRGWGYRLLRCVLHRELSGGLRKALRASPALACDLRVGGWSALQLARADSLLAGPGFTEALRSVSSSQCYCSSPSRRSFRGAHKATESSSVALRRSRVRACRFLVVTPCRAWRPRRSIGRSLAEGEDLRGLLNPQREFPSDEALASMRARIRRRARAKTAGRAEPGVRLAPCPWAPAVVVTAFLVCDKPREERVLGDAQLGIETEERLLRAVDGALSQAVRAEALARAAGGRRA